MSSPVGSVTAVPPPPPLPEPGPAPPGRFAQRLAELAAQAPSPAAEWVHRLNRDLNAGAQNVEALMEAAKTGQHLSNAELIAMQAGMYQYTLTIELVSKVISALTAGLKELLKMQV